MYDTDTLVIVTLWESFIIARNQSQQRSGFAIFRFNLSTDFA